MRIKKSKHDEIVAAWRAGEIKQVGIGFSVLSRFFVLGIMPRMVTQVVAELKEEVKP